MTPVRKLYKKERVDKNKKTTFVRSNGVKVSNPTSKNSWKGFERVVATFFGTKRVPLSGSNSGHNTNSDTLHKKLYIECKFRNKFSIFALFKDTEVKANVEGKVPIVAIKQKGEKGFLIVIRPQDLEKVTQIRLENEQGKKGT